MDNNNIQAGLANIKANAEFNTDLKAADNIHTQFGGTYNDNRTIIVQGITREEMNACLDLKIHEKIESFKKELESDILPNKLEKLKSDVGVITSYKETISISAIKNDEDFDKVLSSVLKERIESDDTDTQNICSLSISTMKNLTKSHLKIIAFLYLFQSNYVKYNTNSKNFLEFYDKYIEPLVDFPFKKLQELGITILGNGIAVAFTLGWDIISYLPNSFYDPLTGKLYDINLDIKTKIVHLGSIWKELATSSSKLTSVGKCIGKTYLHDILGLDVIEQIETKTKSNGITHSDLARIHKI